MGKKNTWSRTLGACAALALIVAAPGALAQGTDRRADDPGARTTPERGETSRATVVPPACSQNYDRYDEDGDGKVTRAEFVKVPSAFADPDQAYTERDQDRDGSLTKTEFCAGWGASAATVGTRDPRGQHGALSGKKGARGATLQKAGCQEHFSYYDLDEDGNIQRAEFDQAPQIFGSSDRLFQQRDRDGDERLSQEEFCQGWDQGMDTRGLASTSAAGLGTKGLSASDCQQKFAIFDENGDGRITEDEVAGWPRFGTRQAASISERGTRAGQLQLPATQTQFCAALPDSGAGDSKTSPGTGGDRPIRRDRPAGSTDQPERSTDQPDRPSDPPNQPNRPTPDR
jgi:Ca2+-binding EF-hand superfamily protein